jgi:hypothetical protein
MQVVMLRVLQIIQLLLQQNRHASKRDVYYTDPAVFLGEYILLYMGIFVNPEMLIMLF